MIYCFIVTILSILGFDQWPGWGKDGHCWVEQGEGGELQGCSWKEMLEEDFSANNQNNRWAFIPFFVEAQIGNFELFLNCQNVILFLRDFGLPHRRAFCHSGLRWRRHFLLQQWWLISFCLCSMNIVHDILNLTFNVLDVKCFEFDVQCFLCCWHKMLLKRRM